MTQTHTDPRLTITLTTHAAEGLRGEHERTIHRLQVRVGNLEAGKKQSDEAWRWEHTKAEGLESQVVDLKAEVERLRAQVACEADATETIWSQKKGRDGVIADLRSQLATLQRLGDAIHREADRWFSGDGQNGDAFWDAIAAWPATEPSEAISKLANLGFTTPTQTEAEAEVERLRRTVDERDSTIAELHVSLERMEGQLAASQAREDDTNRRLQGLIVAVYEHSRAAWPIDDNWMAIRHAADAARQPTEAP